MKKSIGSNPFKKRTVKPKTIPETVAKPFLPNDQASLVQRANKRKHFDLNAVSLDVCNETSTNLYRRSFVKMVTDQPQYEILIKQLLHGAQLDLGSRIVTYQSHQDCYYSIEEFIGSLNSPGLQNQRQISFVAEINHQTTKNFVAYLLQQWPGRSCNRKRYGRLKAIINKLQKQYDGDPHIGGPLTWAQPPGNTDTPSESYPDHIFNQLVEASLSDVKFVMKMMKDYAATSNYYKQMILPPYNRTQPVA